MMAPAIEDRFVPADISGSPGPVPDSARRAEACRSASEIKTTVFRAVAPRLIQAGVGSVLSMGHAVHVEAAKILLDRFYRELVRGTTIGQAVAQGRSALVATRRPLARIRPRGRTLDLEDGFLPTSTSAGWNNRCCHRPAKQQAVRQYDVFLSHRKNDSARVEALARILAEKHGLRVWFDKIDDSIKKQGMAQDRHPLDSEVWLLWERRLPRTSFIRGSASTSRQPAFAESYGGQEMPLPQKNRSATRLDFLGSGQPFLCAAAAGISETTHRCPPASGQTPCIVQISAGSWRVMYQMALDGSPRKLTDS